MASGIKPPPGGAVATGIASPLSAYDAKLPKVGKPAPGSSVEILGTTGLLQTAGFLYEEFIPLLRGRDGAKKFQEMQDNDPILAAVVYAITMLVRQVEWHVEPADKSKQAIEAAEFVEQCLFEDMADTWSDFLSEVMTMIVHGYSLFEIVWKVRNGQDPSSVRSSRFKDKKIGVGRLAPRSQLTVWRWLITYFGDIRGVEQIIYNTGSIVPNEPIPDTVRSGVATIPIEKMLLFRTTSSRGNPEGKSLLRSCFVPYLRKKNIEEAEGRLALRSAGIVVIKVPEEMMDPGADDATKAALANWNKTAAALAQDRNGSVTIPSDVFPESKTPKYDVSYVVADGRRTMDTSTIIERIDKRMAMSALADFILIGHNARSGSGSYALSSNKTDVFMTALGAFVNGIADVINRQLLPRLWAFNGMNEDIIPTLTPNEIEAPALDQLGQLLTALSGAGAQLFPDLTLENAIRHEAGWPEKEEDSLTALIGDAKGRTQLAASEGLLAAGSEGAPGLEAGLGPGGAPAGAPPAQNRKQPPGAQNGAGNAPKGPPAARNGASGAQKLPVGAPRPGGPPPPGLETVPRNRLGKFFNRGR